MDCIIENYWKVFLTIFFTLFEDCLYFIEAILFLDFISDLLLKQFEFFIYFLYWDYFETGTILKPGLFWNRDYFERDYFGQDYFRPGTILNPGLLWGGLFWAGLLWAGLFCTGLSSNPAIELVHPISGFK